MRKSGFVGQPKFPPFEDECKKHFTIMLNAFKQIDWPARKDEIKGYIETLNINIKNKYFNKEIAQDFLSNIQNFLYLYRSVTRYPAKKRIAGEKELHHSAQRLKVEIHKKPKENKNGHQ